MQNNATGQPLPRACLIFVVEPVRQPNARSQHTHGTGRSCRSEAAHTETYTNTDAKTKEEQEDEEDSTTARRLGI